MFYKHNSYSIHFLSFLFFSFLFFVINKFNSMAKSYHLFWASEIETQKFIHRKPHSCPTLALSPPSMSINLPTAEKTLACLLILISKIQIWRERERVEVRDWVMLVQDFFFFFGGWGWGGELGVGCGIYFTFWTHFNPFELEAKSTLK